MIERVDLSNWKGHHRFEAEFKPGLNFILGPNGSGKSSLLQAIEFALLGATPSGTPRDSIRMGSTDGASVSITLNQDLPRATFLRTIDGKGRISEPLLTKDGAALPSSEHLAGLLGVEGLELATLLFLNEGDIYQRDAGDLELDHHLERLLPLKALREVAGIARDQRRSLSRLLKGQRTELKLSKEESAQLAERRSVLDAELSELEQVETALRNKERDLLAATRERDLYNQTALRLASWSETLAGVLESNGLGGVEPEVALENLAESVRQAEQHVRHLVAQQGRYQGERVGVETALSLLQQAETGACPLCAQPLTNEHRNDLLNGQHDRMVQLDQLLDSCVADLTEAERQLAEITAAATSVRSLIAQRPEIVNLSQTLTPTLDEDLAQAQGDIEDLRSRRRTAFDELAGVRERLASAESDRRIVEEVVDAFRKDALLEATEAAVGSFSSEVRAGIVTPLSQELGRQWKRFRPKAPWNLVIGQDGCLAIEMLGETRPHSVLSAGEKTVAIVLLKVALAVAFTSASFMVLDEPLEHLDPRTRRVLISSLQHAVEHHVVDQIIVSTYEEVIVRRLQQQGLAHAIYMD